MACGEITIGSAADCNNLPSGGTVAEVTVFNYDDVESYTEDSDGVISDIVLKAGKTGFKFTGFRNDVKKTEEVIIPDTGAPGFKHTASFIVYNRDQITKNNIENLARGKFVLIVENKGKDNAAFEVVGKGVGVSIVAGVIRDAHANGGFFVLSFATADGDGEIENKLPQTLFDTDYATTAALVESLSASS